MTGEQIPAQTEVQGEPPVDFPVILEIGAHFKVSPVAAVGGQLRCGILVKRFARRAANPRIYSGIFLGRSIRREEHGIEHLIGRPRYAERAVLQVPAKIYSNFHIVVAVVDRDHVGVGVDMLHKRLRIP